MRMLPTDYYLYRRAVHEADRGAEKRAVAGRQDFLDPVPTQLVRFYGQIVRLDFGESRRIQSGVDVIKVIGSKFTVSMRLGVISLGISLVLGVLIGIMPDTT